MELLDNLVGLEIRCVFKRKIKGIGLSRAGYICSLLGISNPFYISNIDNIYYFWGLLERIPHTFYVIDSRLSRLKQQRIKFLVDSLSYRGFRSKMNLPWRGQRTMSNAKTRKRFKII